MKKLTLPWQWESGHRAVGRKYLQRVERAKRCVSCGEGCLPKWEMNAALCWQKHKVNCSCLLEHVKSKRISFGGLHTKVERGRMVWWITHQGEGGENGLVDYTPRWRGGEWSGGLHTKVKKGRVHCDRLAAGVRTLKLVLQSVNRTDWSVWVGYPLRWKVSVAKY